MSTSTYESGLLDLRESYSYMKCSRTTFLTQVAPRVPRVMIAPSRPLYRRADLDAFIEARMEPPKEPVT